MVDVAVSWSGGKDSCLALHVAKDSGFNPVVLLCMVDQRGYSRSNGINRQILKLQAQALQLPIVFQETSWVNYEQNIIRALINLKLSYKVTQCVFGDIDMHIVNLNRRFVMLQVLKLICHYGAFPEN